MCIRDRKGLVGISTSKNTLENPLMEFPFASYQTSINRAQWNINAKTIAMKGDVATSTFTSTAPDQAGLTFNGSSALYEIEKMTLNIGGVPFIKSADAKVLQMCIRDSYMGTDSLHHPGVQLSYSEATGTVKTQPASVKSGFHYTPYSDS